MKYKMNVTIADPNTKEGMISDLYFELKCYFTKDEETYGNKHYLCITGKGFSEQHYDIRYDTEFRSESKIEYLVRWASNYWNGKNGAYKLKAIAISELKEKR